MNEFRTKEKEHTKNTKKFNTNWSMWLVNWFSVVWYRLKHFWNVIPILLSVDQPTISGRTSAVDGSGFERQVARYFHSVQFVQWHHFRS